MHLDQEIEKAPRRTPAHLVNHADKRVRHTSIVSLSERFEDLVVRYGISSDRREGIEGLYEKVRTLEERIFNQLDFDPEGLSELNSVDIKTLLAL